MKKTLDRKIKEFKTIAYKGYSNRQLYLLGEIYSLSEVLNCKLEVAKDLAEFLEAKEKEIKANKKDNKINVFKSEYNDVILLRVDEKMNIEQILALIEDVRPDYAERYHDIGIAEDNEGELVIIIEYKGRKDIVIKPDLSGLNDLELATLCMQIDTFLN